MTNLTRASLPLIAQQLALNVNHVLFDRARLAGEARQAGIADYAAIIGNAFRRSESTVSHWARSWDWFLSTKWKGSIPDLPYSFFESCARYSDRIETADLCEKLMNYHDSPGATLESFRAELATMAGTDANAEFRTFLGKTRRAILSRVDQAPTKRGGDYLKTAADALADALGEMEGERVTA